MTVKKSLSAAILLSVLLLVGAGCAPKGRAVMAARGMMPENFSIMPGLEPYDEKSWKLVGEPGAQAIDTHWRTSALFDKVQLYYVDFINKTWGLTTHTVADKDSVRVYWGLTANVRGMVQDSKHYIAITKAQTDGKTDVEIILEPRIP